MGQERVGSDAVTGIAPLRWNFNASTTPTNAYRFLSTMLNDGTLSRLDLSTIIRDEKDHTPPVMGIYDETFANELKPYIEHLDAANGLIDCEESTQLALAMRDENEDRIRLYESEAYRVLSYRANVIAWLKGMKPPHLVGSVLGIRTDRFGCLDTERKREQDHEERKNKISFHLTCLPSVQHCRTSPRSSHPR